MGKYNILITGTGGCGVGEGIYKSLKDIVDYNLFSTNSSDNSLFLFGNPGQSFIVPNANDPNYCQIILNICVTNNIKIIIPGSEPELVTLVNNRNLFKEYGIIVLANSENIIKTFDNKWETFLALRSLEIKTPDTTLDIDDDAFFKKNQFPFIIKPIIGNASKNVFVVNNQEELNIIYHYFKIKKIPFVIQEHIGTADEEFTISIISDFDGNYLGSIVLKRVLAGGFSQFVECNEFKSIDEVARDISKKIKSVGPINIQCRLLNGDLYVFEINPRFSGTTPFRTLLGFNEADILIRKIFEGKNYFDRSILKFNTFGVRGFVEKVYPSNIKSQVKNFK